MPPVKENEITNILFSQTYIHDYEKLCSLDCLGVSEKQDKLQGTKWAWSWGVLRNQFNLEREPSAYTR